MATAELLELLPFASRLESEGLEEFLSTHKDQSTMQLNITKNCNLACKHCHVGSSPERTEEMSREALQACLDVFATGPFANLDVTGGAPELSTHYRWLMGEASRIASDKQSQGLATRIITRTNATLLTVPGFEDLPELWAKQSIEVAVSLPHYEKRMTDKMRGEGVFERVIAGLQALNAAGYGCNEDLTLNVVVNPGGAILPGSQASAELEYKRELSERYGIVFDNLLIITNNPVGRFKDFLEGRGILDTYLAKLSDAFNPATVKGAMCRDQISVDVDGRIYDCDFNQIVEMPVLKTCQSKDYLLEDAYNNPVPALTIFDLQEQGLDIVSPRKIRVDEHCYACTAGAGSSCGGSTT